MKKTLAGLLCTAASFVPTTGNAGELPADIRWAYNEASKLDKSIEDPINPVTGEDTWQLPKYTGQIRAGDCEDLTFLVDFYGHKYEGFEIQSGFPKEIKRYSDGSEKVFYSKIRHFWGEYTHEDGTRYIIDPTWEKIGTEEEVRKEGFVYTPEKKSPEMIKRLNEHTSKYRK